MENQRSSQLKLLVQDYYERFDWVTIPLLWKAPQFKDWEKTTCPDDIPYEAFIKSNNIGLICGNISKILVLDISSKSRFSKDKQGLISVKTGIEEWDIYIQKHGEPRTFKSKTGTGGLHYFFAFNEEVSNLTNRKDVGKNDKGETVAWDIITTGGQVVITPSIHPDTNVKYEWDISANKISTVPKHLLNIMLSSNM